MIHVNLVNAGEKWMHTKGNSNRTPSVNSVDPVICSVLSVNVSLTDEGCFSDFHSPPSPIESDEKPFNTSESLQAVIFVIIFSVPALKNISSCYCLAASLINLY